MFKEASASAEASLRFIMDVVEVKLLREGAVVPTRGTDASAGVDLYACSETEIEIPSGKTAMIPTGISMAIPYSYVGLIFARSSLALREGLAPANKVGVIDADYRGEIFVPIYNQSSQTRRISPGQRFCQMVILPCLMADFCQVQSLNSTQRGSGGFGSTGFQ